jgi:hypothetical protein
MTSIGDKLISPVITGEFAPEYGLTYRQWLIGQALVNPELIYYEEKQENINGCIQTVREYDTEQTGKRIRIHVNELIKQLDSETKPKE